MKKLFILTTIILLSACYKSPQKMSNETLVSVLKEKARNLQDAILTRNLEEFNKHVDSTITFTSGESNLGKFIEMTPEKLMGGDFDSNGTPKVKWSELELYDIDVSLSPDSKTAVLNFYAKGEYQIAMTSSTTADFSDPKAFSTDVNPDEPDSFYWYFLDPGSAEKYPEYAPVKYSTRASSVWISTKNGWKIMHSNWAPFDGGTGIPE